MNLSIVSVLASLVVALGTIVWSLFRDGRVKKQLASERQARESAQRNEETYRRGMERADGQHRTDLEVIRGLKEELRRADERAQAALRHHVDDAMAAAALGDPGPAGQLLRDIMHEDGHGSDPGVDGTGDGHPAAPGTSGVGRSDHSRR